MSKVSDRQHTVTSAVASTTSMGESKPRRTRAGDAFSGLAFRVLRVAASLEAGGDALARPAGQSSGHARGGGAAGGRRRRAERVGAGEAWGGGRGGGGGGGRGWGGGARARPPPQPPPRAP